MGKRTLHFGNQLFIDQSDFQEVPEPGFKRLKLGGEARLRGAYVIKCDEVIKDEAGNPIKLICSMDPNTLGKKPEGRKVKGVVHWVNAAEAVALTVRDFDHLFEEGATPEDMMEKLNPNSKVDYPNALAEPALASVSSDDMAFQCERVGYYKVDTEKDSQGRIQLNQTVGLKDTWKPA
jgi:glutaminyl-tRNA synthetase